MYAPAPRIPFQPSRSTDPSWSQSHPCATLLPNYLHPFTPNLPAPSTASQSPPRPTQPTGPFSAAHYVKSPARAHGRVESRTGAAGASQGISETVLGKRVAREGSLEAGEGRAGAGQSTGAGLVAEEEHTLQGEKVDSHPVPLLGGNGLDGNSAGKRRESPARKKSKLVPSPSTLHTSPHLPPLAPSSSTSTATSHDEAPFSSVQDHPAESAEPNQPLTTSPSGIVVDVDSSADVPSKRKHPRRSKIEIVIYKRRSAPTRTLSHSLPERTSASPSKPLPSGTSALIPYLNIPSSSHVSPQHPKPHSHSTPNPIPPPVVPLPQGTLVDRPPRAPLSIPPNLRVFNPDFSAFEQIGYLVKGRFRPRKERVRRPVLPPAPPATESVPTGPRRTGRMRTQAALPSERPRSVILQKQAGRGWSSSGSEAGSSDDEDRFVSMGRKGIALALAREVREEEEEKRVTTEEFWDTVWEWGEPVEERWRVKGYTFSPKERYRTGVEDDDDSAPSSSDDEEDQVSLDGEIETEYDDEHRNSIETDRPDLLPRGSPFPIPLVATSPLFRPASPSPSPSPPASLSLSAPRSSSSSPTSIDPPPLLPTPKELRQQKRLQRKIAMLQQPNTIRPLRALTHLPRVRGPIRPFSVGLDGDGDGDGGVAVKEEEEEKLEETPPQIVQVAFRKLGLFEGAGIRPLKPSTPTATSLESPEVRPDVLASEEDRVREEAGVVRTWGVADWGMLRMLERMKEEERRMSARPKRIVEVVIVRPSSASASGLKRGGPSAVNVDTEMDTDGRREDDGGA